MTTWSPQQEAALAAVRKWFRDAHSARARCEPFQQVFYLAGYAGTGKSTLARVLASHARSVCYGAFTGKAALVMRAKGCTDARTIHSLIYSVAIDDLGLPTFALNPASEVAEADLVVIDECSMVGADLGNDLLSFGVPVLVIGDPAQLPPVQDAGFFTRRTPDVMLTEVHRQARDNPIIRLSMEVREGRRLDFGTYGDSKVVRSTEVAREEVMTADQVLVGRNLTRRAYNARVRTLLGHKKPVPVAGERLVCLKNNRNKGLLNGGTWTVAKVLEKPKPRDPRSWLAIVPTENPEAQAIAVRVHKAFFAGEEGELSREVRRRSDEFDFGYVLTVHKSQGSQWDNVYLFDESGVFRDDARKWLYTGITRAAKAVTVVRAA